MNVYFTVSYRNAQDNEKDVRALLEHLTKSGNKVIKRDFKVSSEKLDAEQKQISDILNFRETDLSEIYKSILRKIREADVVIADTSVPSSSVGYEIAIAQNERKPILVLHSNENIDFLADVIGGNTSKIFKLAKYSKVEEANNEIDQFLKEARDMIDTKFILIISPEIDKYLQWSSEERRMHKAQIVRNAVEDTMNKDKEYKQFRKDHGLD